jgi:hypothetical protein
VQTGAAGRDVPSDVKPVFIAPDAPSAIADILRRIGVAEAPVKSEK